MKRNVIAIAFIGLLGLMELATAQDLPASQSNYVVTPRSIVRGKDYNVVIRTDTRCTPGSGGPFFNVRVDLEGVTGFTSSTAASTDGCFLRLKISVAPDAPLGPLNLLLMKYEKDDDVKPTNAKPFAVASITVDAVERGPIPPGLDEQVDVLWKVLPRRATSDSFGRRVAELFFAVEVVVGNNSGYDLQITSVGFTLTTNPDPALREKLQAPLPSDSYGVVRSVIEREQQVGVRAIVFGAISGIGPILAAITPLLEATAQEQYVSSIVLLSPLIEGLGRVFPDRTVRHLVGLDSRALRDSVIVPNNISQRIFVFVSREVVMCSRDRPQPDCSTQLMKWNKNHFDPSTVMEKLGRLVLVGKSISYLNRVRVVSAPEPVVSPPPVVQPLSELKIAQGTAGKQFSLGGANLRGAAMSMEPGTPLQNLQATPSGSGTLVVFETGTKYDAKPGKYKLYVGTSSGQAILEMEVTAEPPRLKNDHPPLSVSQASTAGEFSLTLEGKFLKDVKEVKVLGEDGGKFKVEKIEGAGDEENKSQSLKVAFASLRDAAPKKYEVQVTRPTGGSARLPFELKPAVPKVKPQTKTVKKGSDLSPLRLDVEGEFLLYATLEAPEGSGLKITYGDRTEKKLTARVDFTAATKGTHILTIKNGSESAKENIGLKVE